MSRVEILTLVFKHFALLQVVANQSSSIKEVFSSSFLLVFASVMIISISLAVLSDICYESFPEEVDILCSISGPVGYKEVLGDTGILSENSCRRCANDWLV